MRYQAIYERANDGTIWGYVPDLPGATGAGDSLDDAKASLAEGVRLWIQVTKERGEAIPEPSTVATDTIDVPAA